MVAEAETRMDVSALGVALEEEEVVVEAEMETALERDAIMER